MKKVVNFACLSLLSVASFSISNCKKETVQPFQYQIPQKTVDNLDISSLENEGIDSTLYYKFFNSLPVPKEHKINSFLLLRNNKLVLEQYFGGYSIDKKHDMRSATKSITSLLVGIAIEKGFIKSENDPIINYLDDYQTIIKDKNIRIIDLLNMNSGLDCNDWVPASTGNEEKMYNTKDWVKFILELNNKYPKSDTAVYCTGGVVVLGYIIQKASKMKLDAFALKYLFEPLGIMDYQWAYYNDNKHVDTGGHLFMKPRDMAKIGLLMQNKGIFNQKQVISEKWVEKCTSMQTKFYDNGKVINYGYLWWKQSFDFNAKTYSYSYAIGNGGQFIINLPSANVVAIFTGENYNAANTDLPFEVLKKVIIPSLKN
jgi:CubicO group peptidase (beta-lactamase class C family)